MKIDEGIDDEDGTIKDAPLETFYSELEYITVDEGGFFRIVGDDGPSFVEIRVPFEAFEKLGWRNGSHDDNRTVHNSAEGAATVHPEGAQAGAGAERG